MADVSYFASRIKESIAEDNSRTQNDFFNKMELHNIMYFINDNLFLPFIQLVSFAFLGVRTRNCRCERITIDILGDVREVIKHI